MIRVFEAFSGYGSQRMALDNLGIEHEVVAISEIDKFAIKSYEAIHGKTNNLGDISKIKVEDIPDHDLFTYSFPCQDISVAGRQEGFDKGSGTRSGLLWECERIITNKKPKYLLMENVKNLVGKKFMKGFQEWIDYLESVGYSNYWKVLNAKDYGIPQNRERVFMVSILGEHEPFEFPKPTKLEKRLKDVLKPEVDEKYYLSTERSKQLISTIIDENELNEPTVVDASINEPKIKEVMNTITARYDAGIQNLRTIGGAVIEPKLQQIARYDTETRKNSNRFRTYNPNGISPALSTMGGGGLEPHIPEAEPKIIDNLYSNREPRVYDETSPTIRAERHGLDVAEPCNNDNYESELTPKGFKTAINVIDQYRIRKLTPLECWRLMGVKDELFYKAQEVNSNTQLYKQAGNSIVVQVLERIFEKMFKEHIRWNKN